MAYRVTIRDGEQREAHRLRRCSPELAALVVADTRAAYPSAQVRCEPAATRRGGESR